MIVEPTPDAAALLAVDLATARRDFMREASVLIPTSWHTRVTNLRWLRTDEGVVSVAGNDTSLSGGIIKVLRRDLALRA